MSEIIDGSNVSEDTTAAAEQNLPETDQESATDENAVESQNDATDLENEDSEEGTEEREQPRKSGFERRVEKLNKRLSDREREIEYWKQQALGASSPKQPEQTQASDKPKFEDYNDLEAYTEAVTDWKLEHKLAQRDQNTKQRSAIDTYQGRVTEFVKQTPDFQEVLADADDVQLAPEVMHAIVDSEVGPQIAYYLAKNVSEVDRINKLPQGKRLIEFGKLEAKLSAPAQAKAQPKVVSKAPAPINTVSGTKAIVQKSPEDMSQGEYNAWRSEQLRNKKKR
jgi:hypothetical protein